MKSFKDFMILVPVGLALTACGSSSSGTTASDNTNGAAAVVANAPGPSSGSVSTPIVTGASGASSIVTTSTGCGQVTLHPVYSYPTLSGVGSGATQTTPNEIVADSILRVSITPGSANGTIGTGATANYTYMSADVHLLANGSEIAKMTIAGTGVQAPNGYTYPMGIPVGQTSNPASADFSNYIIGRSNTTYSLYVTNVKTDYKCNQVATFAYYETMGDCAYYYNPNQYATSVCSGNWNWDYHQATWACCYTNMLEQAQELQCGVGTPLSNSTYSVSVQVETDSTPCITPN